MPPAADGGEAGAVQAAGPGALPAAIGAVGAKAQVDLGGRGRRPLVAGPAKLHLLRLLGALGAQVATALQVAAPEGPVEEVPVPAAPAVAEVAALPAVLAEAAALAVAPAVRGGVGAAVLELLQPGRVDEDALVEAAAAEPEAKRAAGVELRGVRPRELEAGVAPLLALPGALLAVVELAGPEGGVGPALRGAAHALRAGAGLLGERVLAPEPLGHPRLGGDLQTTADVPPVRAAALREHGRHPPHVDLAVAEAGGHPALAVAVARGLAPSLPSRGPPDSEVVCGEEHLPSTR